MLMFCQYDLYCCYVFFHFLITLKLIVLSPRIFAACFSRAPNSICFDQHSYPPRRADKNCVGAVTCFLSNQVRNLSGKNYRHIHRTFLRPLLCSVQSSWAKDIEFQRKELALEPGSFKSAYYATLRGGMCSAYCAASVIASDMVTTSKTGAMGKVGFVEFLTCAVNLLPCCRSLSIVFSSQ